MQIGYPFKIDFDLRFNKNKKLLCKTRTKKGEARWSKLAAVQQCLTFYSCPFKFSQTLSKSFRSLVKTLFFEQ